MATAPRILLTGLLLWAPSAALAIDDSDLDDNDLMEEVDEDIFSSTTEEAPLEDWELSGEPAGDDPADDLTAIGDDPDEGFGDPADDLAAIAPGGDPPGDFVGLPADPPDDGGDFDDFGEDPPADMAAIAGPSGGPGRSSSLLDTDGKQPLSGAFDASVVGSDIDAVVVELPVLIARSASTWGDSDYWLVAEFTVKGKKVGEARHLVTKAGLADLAPTITWIKSQVPVLDAKGAVVVSVSKQTLSGSEALFKKTVGYQL
jgi:hypothetical protein